MRSCIICHAHMYSSRGVLGLSSMRCKYSRVIVVLLSNIVRFWFITLFSFSITHFSGQVKGLAGLVRTRRV
jgi:hypothetical protein